MTYRFVCMMLLGFVAFPAFTTSEDEAPIDRFGMPVKVLPTSHIPSLMLSDPRERHDSESDSDTSTSSSSASHDSGDDSNSGEYLSDEEDISGLASSPQFTSVSLGPRCAILSLDGGGVRGYIEALILQAMETSFKRKLADRGLDDANLIEAFDLVVGTSAGAITAGCLTVPSEHDRKKPRHSVATLLGFYEGEEYDEDDGAPLFVDTEAASMFERSWWRRLTSFFGLFDERYSTSPLKRALKRYGLKNTPLRHACVPTAMVTAEITNRGRGSQPIYFRSYDARGPFKNVDMRDGTLCSGAAPTYFERMRLIDAQGRTRYFVDGGLTGANNPAVVAAGEAAHALGHLCAGSKDNMFIVSVGTGIAPVNVDGAGAADWGLATWVRPIIDLTLSLPTLTNERTLRTIFGVYTPGQSSGYVRLTPQLDRESPLDDASPAAMGMLRATALEYIGQNQETIEATVEQLVLRFIAKQAAGAPGKAEVKESFRRLPLQIPGNFSFAG